MKDREGWEMTFTEFNNHFEANITQAPSYIEAYRMTEGLHETLTGVTKYSGYDSFRKAKQRKK
jgi:hypothetical protein